jgi:hypothetical protein
VGGVIRDSNGVWVGGFSWARNGLVKVAMSKLTLAQAQLSLSCTQTKKLAQGHFNDFINHYTDLISALTQHTR